MFLSLWSRFPEAFTTVSGRGTVLGFGLRVALQSIPRHPVPASLDMSGAVRPSTVHSPHPCALRAGGRFVTGSLIVGSFCAQGWVFALVGGGLVGDGQAGTGSDVVDIR